MKVKQNICLYLATLEVQFFIVKYIFTNFHDLIRFFHLKSTFLLFYIMMFPHMELAIKVGYGTERKSALKIYY